MSERIVFYSNSGKPFVTRDEAEMKKSRVENGLEDSNAWVKMKNIGPKTTTKVEVVEHDDGFIVKQTVTKVV